MINSTIKSLAICKISYWLSMARDWKTQPPLTMSTHVVELFAAEDRLCLAMEQIPSVEKSTLASILKQVDVRGAIISADAHFTVSESADQVVGAGADYLFAVKNNQLTLCAELENFFDQAHEVEWEEVPHSFHKSINKEHGRIESREARVVEEINWLPEHLKWEKLTSLIEVRRVREEVGKASAEEDRRLYISSRQASAALFAEWTQGHWSIKNKCHWVADVIFAEDASLTDRGHSAENMALFRRLAMNIAAIADPKRGLASVGRAAVFGAGYLKGILAMIFCQKVSRNFS